MVTKINFDNRHVVVSGDAREARASIVPHGRSMIRLGKRPPQWSAIFEATRVPVACEFSFEADVKLAPAVEKIMQRNVENIEAKMRESKSAYNCLVNYFSRNGKAFE
jgi:hypothetical protein